jgi:hypothetical protein
MLKQPASSTLSLQAAMLACILLTLFGCSSTTPQHTADEQLFPDFCSMEALLATPERYHGRRVQVIGYARVEFEYDVLFPLKEYDDHGISYSTIWLGFNDSLIDIEDPESFDRSYILVEGTFDALNHGHGFSQGMIHQITAIGKTE